MLKTKNRKLALQSLESREVPAAWLFDPQTTNDWSTSANWTIGGTRQSSGSPGSADDVTIPNNKLCNFNAGADVTIKSITISGNSQLNLGKVTTVGTKLIVSGSETSTLGDSGSSQASIIATDSTMYSPAFYKSGGIQFFGAQTVNVGNLYASFHNPTVSGAMPIFQFANSSVNFTRGASLNADIVFGIIGGSQPTLTTFDLPSASTEVSLIYKGSFTFADSTQTILKTGSITAGTGNTNIIKVGSFSTVALPGTTTFKVTPTMEFTLSDLYVFGSGATYQGTLDVKSASDVYVWGGSGISSDGISYFRNTSTLNFYGASTSPSDATMAGRYNLDRVSENFYCFQQSKPSSTNPASWAFDTQTTNYTSFNVNITNNASGQGSWTDSGSSQNFTLYYGGGNVGSVKMNTAVTGILAITTGKMKATVVGTMPANTDQDLITFTGAQGISWTSETYVNGPTGSYLNAGKYGVKNY